MTGRAGALPDRVLEGTLAWIDAHLGHFDPFRDGDLTALCEIPLAELSLLTLSALRSGRPAVLRSAEAWLDLLEASHTRAAYRDRPFREPETLVSHLVVAAALERAGRIDATDHRAAVARLVAASTVSAPALPPHRRMELRHALDLAGVPHALPSYAALFRSTIAAHDLNPAFVTKPEAYILTHVVFYAADLGARDPTGIDPADRARLGRLVDVLLAMEVAAGNWDLSAELLLTARCLGTPAAVRDAAWECIADAQLAGGAVPGTRWEPGADIAGTCYHTTLVTSLAGLASA